MQDRNPPPLPRVRYAKRFRPEEEPAILVSLRQELAGLGKSTHASCPYVIVDIDRGSESYCLVIDADWIQFAQETASLRSSLTEGLDLPAAALVAVLTNRQMYHEYLGQETSWQLRPDGVLHVLDGRSSRQRFYL